MPLRKTLEVFLIRSVSECALENENGRRNVFVTSLQGLLAGVSQHRQHQEQTSKFKDRSLG